MDLRGSEGGGQTFDCLEQHAPPIQSLAGGQLRLMVESLIMEREQQCSRWSLYKIIHSSLFWLGMADCDSLLDQTQAAEACCSHPAELGPSRRVLSRALWFWQLLEASWFDVNGSPLISKTTCQRYTSFKLDTESLTKYRVVGEFHNDIFGLDGKKSLLGVRQGFCSEVEMAKTPGQPISRQVKSPEAGSG